MYNSNSEVANIKLPNSVEPLDDELFYSFLLRSAIVNAMLKVSELFQMSGINAQLSGYEIFCSNFDAICILTGLQMSTMDVVSSLTLLPAFAPLMSQAALAGYYGLLTDDDVLSLGFLAKKAVINRINICPECRKSDIAEFGFYYLRRSHQLPGVSVCWRHHCRLKTFTGTFGAEMDYDDDNWSELDFHTEGDLNPVD